MIGARDDPVVGPVEAPVLVEPQVEGVHRRHRRLDVVLERLLDPARECRQHESGLDVLGVHHRNAGVPVLILRVLAQPLDLHQRRGVDAFGNLTAEQQVQAARHDDRVESGIGDEVVDAVADDGPRALALR